MPGPLQYGHGLKAYVVHLLVAQRLLLKRVTHSVHALIAQTLSEATLLHFVLQLHHALAEWERRAVERLLAMPALHVDETSLRVDRNNHWLHVCSGGALTVERLHSRRGCEAIEAIGILPRYAGVAVHDCRASYLSYAHCDWERLQKHEAAVLLFASHPHVAFTNDRAERDLRMSKVKQKVSGCFRTRRYAEAYCRISSYLQSMANQGYNPLVAIQIALAGDAVKNLGE